METQPSTSLSYSSASLLLNCEEKYAHHKIWSTPKDEDIEEDSAALVFGTAFHEILETTLHTANNIREVFNKVVTKYGLDKPTGAVLEAGVISYLEKHKANPYKVIACELEISKDTYLGYVDAIAKNDSGEWCIVDLKTASRIFGELNKRLADDFQLNIYSYYKDDLARQLDLDPTKFMGCSYRVTLKSKLKQKKTESGNDFIHRLLAQCISYDYFVPVDMLSPEKFNDLHKQLHAKAMALRKGDIKPTKNFGYCEAFFRPCNFWSKCHASKWSDERSFLI